MVLLWWWMVLYTYLMAVIAGNRSNTFYINLFCCCLFVFTIFIKGAYLTFKSIFHVVLKDGIIAIWERASVSLLMLSAKQRNYWYHIVTSLVWHDPLSGIEPRTSHTRSQQHSITRPLRRFPLSLLTLRLTSKKNSWLLKTSNTNI